MTGDTCLMERKTLGLRSQNLAVVNEGEDGVRSDGAGSPFASVEVHCGMLMAIDIGVNSRLRNLMVVHFWSNF